jgi:Leucine-rich repeat (LRR) protein
MNTNMSLPSFLALFFVLALASGCKIEITVPEGGKVVSASHAYDCDSGKTCVVEVNDFHFAETFDAHAQEGWIFIGWKVGRGYLCQRSASFCHLSNKGLGQYEAISAVVESDETLFLEPEFVKATPFDEALANVQDERLRACLLKVPPPRRYAEQIRNVDCFDYRYATGSVQGIEAFPRLERLSLLDNGPLTDLQPLGKLSRLQNLKLGLDSSSFNAAALGELKLLHSLTLGSSNPAPLGMTEMSNLQSLRELTLSTNGADLNSISSLVNLRKLNLSIGGLGGRDIGPLAGMTKLETLELSLHTLNDIRALAGMTTLKTLDLSGNQISDIGPLAGLTTLETLDISGNQISDIGPLAGLTTLKTLDISVNRYKPEYQISDISSLAGLTTLETLDLSGNQISDIGPLAGLTTLETLDISGNQISDIGPLAEIESIPVLILDGNLLRDVSPLKQHYPLTLDPDFDVRLGLSYNPISSIGDALDGIRTGRVGLANVPLSCQEYSQLAERYASRWILTDYYHPMGGSMTWLFIYPEVDPSLAISFYNGYQPPRECR